MDFVDRCLTWLINAVGYTHALVIKDTMLGVSFFAAGWIAALFVMAFLMIKVYFDADMDDILSLMRFELGRNKQTRVNAKTAKSFTGMFYVIIGLFYTSIHPRAKYVGNNRGRVLLMARLWFVSMLVVIGIGYFLITHHIHPTDDQIDKLRHEDKRPILYEEVPPINEKKAPSR